MMKKVCAALLFLMTLCVVSARGQQTVTPNVSFQIPAYQQTNWQVPFDYNFNLLDQILGGNLTLPTGTATPLIDMYSNWLTANTGAVSITNFVGGFPGQTIRVICGAADTYTQIVESANIHVAGSFSCSTSLAIQFTLIGTVWTETSRGGGSGGGGGPGTGTQYAVAYWATSSTLGSAGPPTSNGSYLCGYTITGSAAVAPTCPLIGLLPRAGDPTSSGADTILYSDNNGVVQYDGTVAVATALPTPTSLGNPHFFTVLDNTFLNNSILGGVVTVTPATFTINGNATAVIPVGQACRVEVDPLNPTSNWVMSCYLTVSPFVFPDSPGIMGTQITDSTGAAAFLSSQQIALASNLAFAPPLCGFLVSEFYCSNSVGTGFVLTNTGELQLGDSSTTPGTVVIGDGSATLITLSNSGSSTLQSTSLAGSGTKCLHTDNLGNITATADDCGSSGGSVTAVTASSPLASSGGTSPNISIASSTGTGAVVLATSPTLVTPALDTPSAIVLTNASGLPCAALPALTGDVTSSSCVTTLATVNANVGSYTNANITVNGKGQITAAANGSGGGGGANVALNNLSGVAINTGIFPAAAGAVVIGSVALPFTDFVVGPSANESVTLGLNAITGNRTLTVQDQSYILIGKDTTDILTNKTLDTAATGNVLKINSTGITAISGNTGTVVTASGTYTPGDCLDIDAVGNAQDSGSGCSGGATFGWSGVTAGTNANAGNFLMTGNVLNLKGTTQVLQRTSASLTTSANGDLGYDSSALNWHIFGNSVDNLMGIIPASITPSNNDCVKWTVSAGIYTLNTAGAGCGGTQPTFKTNGTNNSTQTGLNLTSSSPFHSLSINVTNTSGIIDNFSLSGSYDLAGLTAPSFANGSDVCSSSGVWTECSPAIVSRTITGGSDTLVLTRGNQLGTFTNYTSNSAVAVALTGATFNGQYANVEFDGTGTVTFTPSTGQVRLGKAALASSLAITGPSVSCSVRSYDGTNFRFDCVSIQ